MSNQLAVLENQFKPLAPRMAGIIPANANLPVERIMQSVLFAFEKTPKLFECSRMSVQSAVFSACSLGLPVDGVTGQGYLVPYGSDAQFQIGFKGYNTIAARSRYILGGDVIYEGEKYSIRLGTGGHAHVDFDPARRFPGAKIVAAYATLESNFAPPLIVALSLDEIEKIRSFSKVTRSDSPWKLHYPQMAIKTVKKLAGKSCPIDILHLAAALDDAVDQGKRAYIRPEDQALIVDHEAMPLSPMQPPRAEEFSLSPSMRFDIVTDKETKDAGSIEAWRSTIINGLGQAQTIAAIGKFTDRNAASFASIAEKFPDVVDDVRLRIMERMAELRKGSP